MRPACLSMTPATAGAPVAPSATAEQLRDHAELTRENETARVERASRFEQRQEPNPQDSTAARAEAQGHEWWRPIANSDKRFATAQARLALGGFLLLRRSEGGFLVGRWGFTRMLEDEAAVEAFLHQVEGAGHDRLA